MVEYTYKLVVETFNDIDSDSNFNKKIHIYKNCGDPLNWILLSIHPIKILISNNKFIFTSFYYNTELYNNLIDNGDIEFHESYFDLKLPKIVYLTPKSLLQLC